MQGAGNQGQEHEPTSRVELGNVETGASPRFRHWGLGNLEHRIQPAVGRELARTARGVQPAATREDGTGDQTGRLVCHVVQTKLLMGSRGDHHSLACQSIQHGTGDKTGVRGHGRSSEAVMATCNAALRSQCASIPPSEAFPRPGRKLGLGNPIVDERLGLWSECYQTDRPTEAGSLVNGLRQVGTGDWGEGGRGRAGPSYPLRTSDAGES